MEMVKDPVCGMDVDKKASQIKSEHDGTTYYFCAPGCKVEFDKNPMEYS